jgi:hypothetical protein
VVHTWPLASAPGTLARLDNADTALNAWAIAWVAHQLPRDPSHLFDANIFFPEPRALAFSEPLIVPSLLVAPLLWLGASAVLAHNLALLAGMALTAFAGYLLAFRFTRYHLAALAAASLVAFNALTLTSIPQIQMQHGWGVLLAVLGLDMLLVEPRRARGALLLAVALLAAALTSGYMAVMALTAVSIGALARAPEMLARRARPAVRNLAVAAVITAALVVLSLSAYWRAHAEQGLARAPATPAAQIASSYLATGARVHHAAWSDRFSAIARLHLFPGVAPAGLALLALVAGRGRLSRCRVRMLAAIALIGVFFSFGAANPVYMGLYQVLPPLQGLRIVARFGLLMLMAVAVLASVGMLQLRRRFGTRRWFPALAVGLLLLVNAEVLRAPRPYGEFEGIPEIYDAMRTTGDDAVLVEFPFPPAQRNEPNARYMLASTRHWRPLVNGYSGFVPASYRERAPRLASFPAGDTLQALIAEGVTHLMIHSREWAGGPAVVAALHRRREVALVAQDDEGRHLFAVRR